jgi:hypothetical protein
LEDVFPQYSLPFQPGFFHHSGRPNIEGIAGREDLMKFQIIETELEQGLGRLGRTTLSPIVPVEAITDEGFPVLGIDDIDAASAEQFPVRKRGGELIIAAGFLLGLGVGKPNEFPGRGRGIGPPGHKTANLGIAGVFLGFFPIQGTMIPKDQSFGLDRDAIFHKSLE